MLLAEVLKPLQACQQRWLGCLQHAQHSAAGAAAAAALSRRSVWNENMEQSEARKAESFYDSTVEKVRTKRGVADVQPSTCRIRQCWFLRTLPISLRLSAR
jgi:hypothetical protein